MAPEACQAVCRWIYILWRRIDMRTRERMSAHLQAPSLPLHITQVVGLCGQYLRAAQERTLALLIAAAATPSWLLATEARYLVWTIRGSSVLWAFEFCPATNRGRLTRWTVRNGSLERAIG